MARKITIPYSLTVSPGAEGDVILYTVPSGYKLKIEKIVTLFPAGTYGELEISLYRGNERVYPEERPLVGDNVLLEDDVELEYPAGSKVKLHYKNTNSTETRVAYIYIKGVLE